MPPIANRVLEEVVLALKEAQNVIYGADDNGDLNAAFVDTDGSLKVGFIADVEVEIPPPSAVVSGRKTVTTAGTAEALGSSTVLEDGVLVMALPDNTNNVFVGDSSVDKDSDKQTELEPGQPWAFAIDDLAKIYVDVTTNGEGVSFSAG